MPRYLAGILIISLLVFAFSSSSKKAKTLSKTEDEIIVHIVPHTHDDTGWNWTFHDYYYGTASHVRGVKDILDSMVKSLTENPNRTFIEVEIAFFSKWWEEQTEATKNKVKQFLQAGRLEFINGGWVMHDEAASYYQHFIDQTRLGMMFLKRELNYIPRIAWFIDPFGHSAANAAVLAKMGFEKIAFVRIDYKEKNLRRANKSLEFRWKPFSQIPSYTKTEIFSHITYAHYCPPPSMTGFIDDDVLQLTDPQWESRADQFYKDLKEWQSGFLTKNVMLMYGCDFTHRVPSNNFRNVEKLMEVMKVKYPNMQLVYSTPSNYFKKVLEEHSDWPIYNNQDFFPYADNETSYWTGYFTSRPYLKGMVRETGNYLANSSKYMMEYLLDLRTQGSDAAKLNESLFHSIYHQEELRKALGIGQHHDAVTGTAKELVSQNYIDMLNKGINKVKKIYNLVTNELINKNGGQPSAFAQVCINPITNFYCEKMYSEVNENKRQKFLAYNNANESSTQMQKRQTSSNYKILDSSEKEIESDILCDIVEHNQKLCEAFFNITFSGPTFIFYVQEVTENRELRGISLTNLTRYEVYHPLDLMIGIKKTTTLLYSDKSLSISSGENDHTLHIKIHENKAKKIQSQDYKVYINHGTYTSYDGNNSSLRKNGSNPDGAYILSTTKLQPDFNTVNFKNSRLFKGKNILQLLFSFGETKLKVRYNPIIEYVFEIETIFSKHSKPGDKDSGKNFILHFKTDLNNNITMTGTFKAPEFWTDANGMKMMRRYKDFRVWHYTITEPVASNFYPVNYAISIREKKIKKEYTNYDYDYISNDDRMLTVFNDRSQSGGAMDIGSVMLILNRFSKKDDWRGVGEAIYEEDSFPYNYRVKNWYAVSNYYNKSQINDFIHQRPTVVSISENPNIDLNRLGKFKI